MVPPGESDRAYQPADRRPIASRELGWVQATARFLVRRRIAPNAISVASAVFAVLGAAAIVATVWVDTFGGRFLWLVAALLIQMRLLANLFDGMVALQSGKASPVGELYNDVPDRISDTVLLVAVGFVPGSSVHLGYSAAILALFVSYLRAVGAAAGAGQVFGGIMAKPQRMFLLTLLCLFECIAPDSWRQPWLAGTAGAPAAVLALVIAGCAVTACTRLSRIASTLKAKS